MQIKLLTTAILSLTLISANALSQEIDLPDILSKQPEKSIATGQAPIIILPGTDDDLSGKEKDRPVIFNSLFFNLNKAASLETAHAMYKQILSTRQLEDANATKEFVMQKAAPPPPPPPPLGTIYLGSVIYKSPQDILVWVNGQKYELGETKDDLTVLKATEDGAVVEWALAGYNFNFNDPKIGANPLVRVNKEKQTLTFPLKINQRLDVGEMKFFAGKNYSIPRTVPVNVNPGGMPGAMPPGMPGQKADLNPQRPESITLPQPLAGTSAMPQTMPNAAMPRPTQQPQAAPPPMQQQSMQPQQKAPATPSNNVMVPNSAVNPPPQNSGSMRPLNSYGTTTQAAQPSSAQPTPVPGNAKENLIADLKKQAATTTDKSKLIEISGRLRGLGDIAGADAIAAKAK